MSTSVDAQLAEANATRPVLDQIANKWSVLILTVLCSEPSRFNAIKRRLDPITHKALTEALRRLERNGLVARHVITASPIAVEYSITAMGRSLQDPFAALIAWAAEHGNTLDQARRDFDDRGATVLAADGGTTVFRIGK